MIDNLTRKDSDTQIYEHEDVSKSADKVIKARKALQEAEKTHRKAIDKRFKEYETMYDEIGIHQLGQSIHKYRTPNYSYVLYKDQGKE